MITAMPLSEKIQIQAVADLLHGLEAYADAASFASPWKDIYLAVIHAEKGQEHDALTAACTKYPDPEKLIQQVLACTPGARPVIDSLNELAHTIRPIEHLWRGYLPRGMVTVVGASQGSGKSFLGMDLSYRVINGVNFPDGTPVPKPGANVIYVDGEVMPQITLERARSYDLDMKKLFLLLPDAGEMIDLNEKKYRDRLVEMSLYKKPELIVIDSLSSVHSGGQNKVEEVRDLMNFFVNLAAWANCAVLVIHHIRKIGSNNGRMLNYDLDLSDLTGSSYITQQARVVLALHVIQTGKEFDENGPRALKVIKNNLGHYEKRLSFSFVPSQHTSGVILEWTDDVPQAYKEPTILDECMAWLENLLSSGQGPMVPKEIVQLAMEEGGFSRPTVFRARRLLDDRIKNTKGNKAPNNQWEWVLDE